MAEQPISTSSRLNSRIARFDAWQKLSLAMIKRCIISALLVGVGLFILFALLSYSPSDSSWSSVSSDGGEIINLMGASGAWFSGVFFAFLGQAAWLLPLFFLYELVNLWWFKYSTPRMLRYPAMVFALLSLSASLTLCVPDVSSHSAMTAGGIVGVELGQSVSLITGKWLALLFTALLFLLAFSYGFQVKWVQLWHSRHRLFEPRVLEAHAVNQQHVGYEHDRTMQPNPAEAQSAARLKQTIKQSLTSPVFSREPRKQTKSTMNETSSMVEPTTSQTRIYKQDNPVYENNVNQQAKAFPQHTATTEPVPTQPIPSRPIAQMEGVSRGEYDESANQIHNDEQFSHVSNKRIDPVFDDLLVLTEPATLHSSDSVELEKPDTLASVNVMDALTQLSDERSDLPSVFGGSQQQGMANQTPATQSVSQKPEKTLSISEKVRLATLAHPQPDLPQDAPLPAKQANMVVESAVDTSESEGVAIFKARMPSKLGNPSNPNGETYFTERVDQDEQIDMLQDVPSLVPEPSFTAAAMAVTEGQTPEDIFDELEAQMNALSDTALTEPVQVNEPVVQAAQLQPENTHVENPLPEKPQQPDYFSETSGSRAFAKAAHRANLSPLPSIELLEKPDPNQKPSYSEAELARLSELLEIKLNEFNIKAQVASAQPGPVVTRFEVDLAPGVKASKVTNIARDLARSLSMASVRVVEVIPGKPYIGIEVPNHQREMVRLYELLITKGFQDPKAGLSMALGKDIAGRPVVTDLAKAPHMLVAGTTGSGKSVAVNAMLLSLLLKYTPEQLRLILIDPKQLELANYNDIPHLLTEVVTDMKDAASALNWCVMEMERRYKLMAFLKVRKLSDYNKKIEAAEQRGEDFLDPLWRPNDDVSTDKPPRLKPIPLVVVVADEFADMIMQVGKQAEELITRLAQKSRAAGIHLILATQRPSVDVITGLIKANIPTRVALRVNSKVDSRTILDSGGAEDMLGNGDMLFLGPGKIEPERAHGAFISDDEVNTICDAWRERGSPDYVEDMMSTFDIDGASPSAGASEGKTIKTGETDAFYDEAVAFVMETRKVSASSIQRKFSIGYNRAARIVDAMEAAGLVSSMGKSGKREILM